MHLPMYWSNIDYKEIEQFAEIINTILGSTPNTIGKGLCHHLKEKIHLHFNHLLLLLHLHSNSET